MNSYTWEILKWGLSLIFGAYSFIDRIQLWKKNKEKIQEADPKISSLTYNFAEPFAYGLILYTALTITQIKYVNFSDSTNSKQEITTLSKNLNATYSSIGNNKILTSIVDDKIADFINFTENANNNTKNIVVDNPNYFIKSAKKIFDLAENNSTILATSYVNPDDWWYSQEGKEYRQQNIDFVKIKKGTIKRIHLFANKAEYNYFLEILKEEKLNKMGVYYLFTDSIPDLLNYNLEQDIIMLSGAFAGKLELNKKRNPVKINYYASEYKYKEFNEVFSGLLKYATEFK